MAARKVKHVGNAAIYIGLPWEKRKSLPRDSRGFEPLDEYFKKTDSDSDSSETDVEELMREERERRKRVVASRAQKKAAVELSTAATKTSDDASETVEELSKQKRDAAKEETAKKKGGHDPVTYGSETSDGKSTANKENEPLSAESGAGASVPPGSGSFVLGVTVEETAAETVVVDRTSNLARTSKYSPVTYSPRQYSLVASPVSNSHSKILPTRLSFSSSDTEGGKGPPSGSKRKRRSTRNIGSALSKRTRVAHQEAAEGGGGSDKEELGDAGGALPEREGAKQNSLSNASFHPQKTSTQVPRGKRGRPRSSNKKANVTRKISRVQPISDDDSDSESDENDELLRSLMNEGELPSRFTGLSQLTRSRQAVAATRVSRSEKKRRVEEKGEFRPHREAKTGGKKPPRKSVTFLKEASVASPRRSSPRRSTGTAEIVPAQDDLEPSESEVELEQEAPPATSSRKERKSTKKAPKRASSVKRAQPSVPPPEDEDEGVDLTSDDGVALKASTGRKSPSKKRALSAADETLKADSSGTGGRGRPKLSGMKQKSILKEVSVVIQKEPSVSHSQWFVPADMSSLYSKRASPQSPKKRETTRRSTLKERESARQRRSRAGTTENRSDTMASESRVEASEAIEMEFEDDGGSSQSDTGGPRGSPSSADSMRGVSAVDTNTADGEAGISDTSRKPSIRKKRKRVVVAKPKRRKPVASDKDEPVCPPEISSDEEEVARGLDVTLSAGGRRYRRLRAGAKKSHTPGVRRSSRTRLAPVRHWEGEEVEYDRRRSGASIRGILVPLDDSVPRPKRKKVKAAEESEDEEFPALKLADRMGNVFEEKSVMNSVSKAEQINGQGHPFEPGDEVAIARLHSGTSSSNGLITFQMLGEKERARSNDYDLFFYVIRGQLLFNINAQQFRLKPRMSIHIPSGCVYGIRNLQRAESEAFFYTHNMSSAETSQASSSEAE